MKRRIIVWGIVAVLALVSFGGYLMYRAKNDLVTLEVRNMDVREVAEKLEAQTREKIIIHKDVQGKITFDVKGATLEHVLGIIADQTSARWSALYPLYTSDDSLDRFTKVARGDLPTETSGWTNLQLRGFGRGPGGPDGPGGFGFMSEALVAQNKVIDFELVNRDVPFAAAALARFGRLVPENGTAGNITVRLKQVPVTKAVAAVADHVDRKWDQYYLVYGDDFGRGDFARGDRDRGERRFGGTNQFDPQAFEARREDRQAEREKMFEAQLATMTPEQQQKVTEERKQLEELRNLTPEERQQRFEQMASRPEVQQRMEQRNYRGVMNTTPGQRAERTKARMERMQRRQQQQQGNNTR